MYDARRYAKECVDELSRGAPPTAIEKGGGVPSQAAAKPQPAPATALEKPPDVGPEQCANCPKNTPEVREKELEAVQGFVDADNAASVEDCVTRGRDDPAAAVGDLDTKLGELEVGLRQVQVRSDADVKAGILTRAQANAAVAALRSLSTKTRACKAQLEKIAAGEGGQQDGGQGQQQFTPPAVQPAAKCGGLNGGGVCTQMDDLFNYLDQLNNGGTANFLPVPPPAR